MAILTKIESESGIVIHDVEGKTTISDFIAAFERLTENPDYRLNYNVIWNLTTADLDSLTGADIQLLSKGIKERMKDREPGYKVAFVAGEDLEFGLSNMYKVYSEEMPLEIKIFRRFEDAVEWVCQP